MSTIEYIEMFTEMLAKLIEIITNFFAGLNLNLGADGDKKDEAPADADA